MPVIIPETLPARQILEGENIFVMGKQRAHHQDIRPLRLAILNLMPTKIATETQLLRLLGNTPLQVEVILLHTCAHEARHTPREHLLKHYFVLEQVQTQKFDGLVITGAPVEQMPFEQVDYWAELRQIMDWSEQSVYSTLHICWAAQAGLYHRYGIPKYPLAEKMFGVFPHRALIRHERLLSGFDDTFYAPHSRHTEIRPQDVDGVPELDLLAVSDEAGVYLAASKNRRQVYVTGHAEYDPLTLQQEYERDRHKGLPIEPPRHYFPGDDPTRPPEVRWRGHAHLLFSNWLNYCVYQSTPYDVQQIPREATRSAF